MVIMRTDLGSPSPPTPGYLYDLFDAVKVQGLRSGGVGGGFNYNHHPNSKS